SVNGAPAHRMGDVQAVIQPHPGRPVTIAYSRHGQLRTAILTPIRNPEGKGQIGVTFGAPLIVTRLSPAAAFETSFGTIGNIIGMTYRSLFHSSLGVRQLSGVIGIAKVSG